MTKTELIKSTVTLLETSGVLNEWHVRFLIPDLCWLTKDELIKICKWTKIVMYEASDNPCRARYAPKCLRQLLPKDHYLQQWRMPKKRHTIQSNCTEGD